MRKGNFLSRHGGTVFGKQTMKVVLRDIVEVEAVSVFRNGFRAEQVRIDTPHILDNVTLEKVQRRLTEFYELPLEMMRVLPAEIEDPQRFYIQMCEKI